MKTILFTALLVLATAMNAPVAEAPYITYQGEKYYYCGYSNDTITTPDGSLQIWNYKVYNHFGCDGINSNK